MFGIQKILKQNINLFKDCFSLDNKLIVPKFNCSKQK